MKAGDYVRTEDGIKKVLKYTYNEKYDNGHCVWFDNKHCGTLFTDEEVNKMKPSSNITDLIEVGDYVNGECVYSRCETKLWLDGDTGEILIIDGEPDEPIKSIVTKEQFESMEYKIGD